MFVFGEDQIPANQLTSVIDNYQPGPPFGDTYLQMRGHPATYDETVAFLEKLFKTLGINNEPKGGNFVICLGPDKTIGAFRA